MGYFPVTYDSGVVNYDRRGFIRLATGVAMPIIGKKPILHSNPLALYDSCCDLWTRLTSSCLIFKLCIFGTNFSSSKVSNDKKWQNVSSGWQFLFFSDYSNLEVPTDTESLFKTNFAGSDFGLSVMLNSRIEDYQLGLGSNIYFGCKVRARATSVLNISTDVSDAGETVTLSIFWTINT